VFYCSRVTAWCLYLLSVLSCLYCMVCPYSMNCMSCLCDNVSWTRFSTSLNHKFNIPNYKSIIRIWARNRCRCVWCIYKRVGLCLCNNVSWTRFYRSLNHKFNIPNYKSIIRIWARNRCRCVWCICVSKLTMSCAITWVGLDSIEVWIRGVYYPKL
jgi:hypothetical protein